MTNQGKHLNPHHASIKPIAQNEDDASYCKKINKESGLIDLQKDDSENSKQLQEEVEKNRMKNNLQAEKLKEKNQLLTQFPLSDGIMWDRVFDSYHC